MKPNNMTGDGIRLVSEPTNEELLRYWEARQADPLVPVFYSDTGPKSFDAFLATIDSGGYVFRLSLRGQELLGAIWLHDIERDSDGLVTDAWIGGYALPDARGRHLLRAMWDLFRPICKQLGVWHIHGGTRKDNEIGYHCAHTQFDLCDVGIFPKFTTFEGVEHDCYIFTLQPQDKERAWKMAYTRWFKAQQITAI